MKICEICGIDEIKTRMYNNKKFGKVLCSKHYMQMSRYGKILTRTIFDPNEIIMHKDCAEIIIYNQYCKEIARTKIDLEDVEKCKQHKWHLDGDGYAVSSKNKKNFMLHRFIMNFPNDMEVDHIFHNTLDNRKSKMRIVTHQQNIMNQQIQKRENKTSKYKGVSWQEKREKWRACIKFKYKKEYLGRFKTENEAGIAYNIRAKELFGEYACLNKIV